MIRHSFFIVFLFVISNASLAASNIVPVVTYLLDDIDNPVTPAIPAMPVEGIAIGIPKPSFGIDESHTMYAGQFYPSGNFNYRDAGNGPYTHYVDNTASNCSDNNAGGFGTAAEPRCTITTFQNPTSLPEGSVMEIHGGPYEFNPGWMRLFLLGSKDSPVFVRGVDNGDQQVRLSRNLVQLASGQINESNFALRLEGQYYIFENLDLYRGVFPQIKDEIVSVPGRPHHIAFRNLEVHGDRVNEVGAGVALSSGPADDVVIYKNHIHHNVRSGNDDLHGTSAGEGTQRLWVLNNHIHNNSGDAFQACHICIARFDKSPPRFVYIGGNLMHEDRENGVDLKTIRDVIISQNIIYGYAGSATSNGDAVVVGSNGVDASLDGIGPDNAWFLFNEIYDSRVGLRVEGVFTGTLIGNYIHNNAAFGVTKDNKAGSQSFRMVNNTITNNARGFHQAGPCNDQLQIDISNNIFSNNSLHATASPCHAGRTFLNRNLFWPAPLPETNQFTAHGSILADPDFISATNPDLKPGSKAVDKATEHPVYQEFVNRYNRDIRFDYHGRSRPAGDSWDLGAFEYQGPN